MFCSRCGEQVDTSTRFCPRCGQDLTALTGGVGGKGGATTPMAAQPPQENETDIVREALKDEYELEKELGRGGMAVVYRARDKQLDREVAIKVLPFSLSFDAEFVERFQREARTAGKLEHPNIIPIYRVGKAGRVIFFVMKFIRGKSLSGVIEARGALPPVEIKRLLTESASALGYAHKHGIVHRDIKPDNIMFDELGQVIVADFGIAKAQSGAKLTGTGMSIGTPHYMSPEQARAQNLDGRSDLYSLGVVAYQCLTGHVPFDGEDSFSIGYKHIMEELPTPSLDSHDQREMFNIVQKMMAKKPDDRYQTAEDLVRALEGTSPQQGGMDMSTMPTRAMEPLKPGQGKPPAASPPVMAAQATAPLPRASASMGKPKDAKEPPAKGERPGAPEKKPSFKPKEVTPKKSYAVPIGIAAVLVLVGGGLGGYLYMNRQKDVVVVTPPPPPPPPVAPAIDSARDTAKVAIAPPPPAPPPGSSKTPGTSKSPGTSRTSTVAVPEGSISLSGVPAGARITLDRQLKSSGRFSAPAGPHLVEVTLQGYTPFQQTVNVVAGAKSNITVPPLARSTTSAVQPPAPPGAAPPPAPPAAAGGMPAICTSPAQNIIQRNRCWDTRPQPRTQPILEAPASCRGNVTAAELMVNVAATGDVISANNRKPSNCSDFTTAARAQVEEMVFTPAMRGGAPVAAWVVVVMRPTAARP